HDVAIVGGGMVGMALACSLATKPYSKDLSIAIIDSNPALRCGNVINEGGPPDARVSTVTPTSIDFFQDIGAWKYVVQNRHAYFDKMQVWDYTGLGYTRYNAGDISKDILGCVVENKVLLGSLISCLQETSSRHEIYPFKLSSLSMESSPSSSTDHGSSAKLELDNGSRLYAKLVVGADGSKSRVKELSGITSTGRNYSQNAIICTVEHALENRCAWQRFLPDGPIALLPVGDRFSNVVWTMSPEESQRRKLMSEVDFVSEVNRALDGGYGPRPKPMPFSAEESSFEVPPEVIGLSSERSSFPLSMNHADVYASKRAVLIGDAAHTVHPLAGQGVNMGFCDAMCLAGVVAEGVAVGSDVGEAGLLKRYEGERRRRNAAMMAVLDGFQKAYGVDLAPLNAVRAAAFHAAQYIPPLKRSIISYASSSGELPI
ncbi:hypothetical protein M569_06359, partial [Genlisea aurea]